MKRYLLFAGDNYYPSGGWGDFVDGFDSVEQAALKLAERSYDWFQIVDATTGEIVAGTNVGMKPT